MKTKQLYRILMRHSQRLQGIPLKQGIGRIAQSTKTCQNLIYFLALLAVAGVGLAVVLSKIAVAASAGFLYAVFRNTKTNVPGLGAAPAIGAGAAGASGSGANPDHDKYYGGPGSHTTFQDDGSYTIWSPKPGGGWRTMTNDVPDTRGPLTKMWMDFEVMFSNVPDNTGLCVGRSGTDEAAKNAAELPQN